MHNTHPVKIGSASDISPEEATQIQEDLLNLRPWRKGPFSLFGIDIDSEWRSDMKWNRLQPHLPDLTDKTVLDIGCNNGYFLFRLAELNPKHIIGIDPSKGCKAQFDYLQQFAKVPNITYLQMGVEELTHPVRLLASTPPLEGNFSSSKDTNSPSVDRGWSAEPQRRVSGVGRGGLGADLLLCLGVLYHHRHPIQMLQILHTLMKLDAQLILETLIIDAKIPSVVVPEKTYAGMRNIFSVPDLSTLLNWLSQTGFEKHEILDVNKTTPDEQRSTLWSHHQSYQSALDTGNGLTKEGYPSPSRVMIKLVKNHK